MKKILTILINQLNKIGGIEGAILNGSVGREDYDTLSDLDLCIYHNAKLDLLEIQTVMQQNFDIIYSLNFDKKLVYFINYLDSFLQIELSLCLTSEIKKSIIYTIESLISYEDLPSVILFDRKNILLKNYYELWDEIMKKNDYESHYLKNKKEFLYYINLLYLNISRKDYFRSHGIYNICIWLLGNLTAISVGEKRNLYQPKFLMGKITQNDINRFNNLIDFKDFQSLEIKINDLIDLYFECISKVEEKPIHTFNKELKLIRKIQTKYNLGGEYDYL